MMRTFTLEIEMSHPTFEPDPRPELARILRDVAREIESGRDLSRWQEVHRDWSVGEIGRYAIKEPVLGIDSRD